MSLTPSQWAALLPLILPALGACLIPLMALDKDQTSVKWIRAAMYGTALLAVGASFWYLTDLWTTGAQPSFFQLHLDRLAQFTGIFVLVAAALTILESWDHFHQEGWVKGETLSLLLFSVTGMMLFASTTHFVTLFLGLELFSIPLYAMVGTVRTRSESAEGGMKYFLTGAVASSCFLMGGVLIYGLSGTLDLASAAFTLKSQGLALDPMVLVGAALMLLGFLFKVSAVPFHQWTPDAYEASPHPIAGFMSVATKGVAFIALLRIFPGSLAPLGAVGVKMQAVMAVLAVVTLVVGNLTALVQTNVKRMLAYSSISHAGYLMLAFVAGTPAAFDGMLYYLVIYLAMNMGAFGLLTAFGLVGGQTTFEDLRGLGWKRPAMGVAAAIFMLSLAGIPPPRRFLRQVHDLPRTGGDGPCRHGDPGRAGQPRVRLLLPALPGGPVPPGSECRGGTPGLGPSGGPCPPGRCRRAGLCRHRPGGRLPPDLPGRRVRPARPGGGARVDPLIRGVDSTRGLEGRSIHRYAKVEGRGDHAPGAWSEGT